MIGDRPRLAGLADGLLVVGMVVSWMGAFVPVPLSYSTPTHEQVAAVLGGPTSWLVATVSFHVGTVLTPAGLFFSLSAVHGVGHSEPLARRRGPRAVF